MKDDRPMIEYERPDWPPEPTKPEFTCHRTDRPLPRQVRRGNAFLWSLIIILVAAVGTIGYALWVAI